MRQELLVPLVMLVLVWPVAAQDKSGGAAAAGADAASPAYDVVSIKPDKSGSGHSSIDSSNYRYTATNVSLRRMLEDAYGVKEDLISGMPKAVNDARFDVMAKAVDPDLKVLSKLTREQYRAMLRPFLMDRFQVKVHTEIKQMPVYEMVVVKGGPKFTEAAESSKEHSGTYINNRELTAYSISMTTLANSLYNQVQRTVIDKTGLTGKYDVALKWSPEDSADPASDAAPPIFTALREQLGLKLQPATRPVEVLVVDHAEMPSPD